MAAASQPAALQRLPPPVGPSRRPQPLQPWWREKGVSWRQHGTARQQAASARGGLSNVSIGRDSPQRFLIWTSPISEAGGWGLSSVPRL
ncbi:hypothetical protein HYH03_006158 [Edaphochlamys debaryana]|uniref:Uncharacterized protein n=1 Tax=Edaphochlamys debaryana TaxID=47281 RepID=A0A835Y428_9CHLO|nr:hypothetical protein HYH03_006158 [Edaphochlamys debaryana]|eukprot:KAG2495558.1 hypothetical protein HYH03_006158 [Edaphochlamys debaryana]